MQIRAQTKRESEIEAKYWSTEAQSRENILRNLVIAALLMYD